MSKTHTDTQARTKESKEQRSSWIPKLWGSKNDNKSKKNNFSKPGRRLGDGSSVYGDDETSQQPSTQRRDEPFQRPGRRLKDGEEYPPSRTRSGDTDRRVERSRPKYLPGGGPTVIDEIISSISNQDPEQGQKVLSSIREGLESEETSEQMQQELAVTIFKHLQQKMQSQNLPLNSVEWGIKGDKNGLSEEEQAWQNAHKPLVSIYDNQGRVDPTLTEVWKSSRTEQGPRMTSFSEEEAEKRRLRSLLFPKSYQPTELPHGMDPLEISDREEADGEFSEIRTDIPDEVCVGTDKRGRRIMKRVHRTYSSWAKDVKKAPPAMKKKDSNGDYVRSRPKSVRFNSMQNTFGDRPQSFKTGMTTEDKALEGVAGNKGVFGVSRQKQPAKSISTALSKTLTSMDSQGLAQCLPGTTLGGLPIFEKTLRGLQTQTNKQDKDSHTSKQGRSYKTTRTTDFNAAIKEKMESEFASFDPSKMISTIKNKRGESLYDAKEERRFAAAFGPQSWTGTNEGVDLSADDPFDMLDTIHTIADRPTDALVGRLSHTTEAQDDDLCSTLEAWLEHGVLLQDYDYDRLLTESANRLRSTMTSLQDETTLRLLDDARRSSRYKKTYFDAVSTQNNALEARARKKADAQEQRRLYKIALAKGIDPESFIRSQGGSSSRGGKSRRGRSGRRKSKRSSRSSGRSSIRGSGSGRGSGGRSEQSDWPSTGAVLEKHKKELTSAGEEANAKAAERRSRRQERASRESELWEDSESIEEKRRPSRKERRRQNREYRQRLASEAQEDGSSYGEDTEY